MAHQLQQQFCEKVKKIYPYYFYNKKVLDIGSLDINGNNRYLFNNTDYFGIDIGEGNNVDFVCIGHEYEAPDNYYDVIISTECFEHDMFYEKTILNAIRMLRSGGLFLFTCATIGRDEHGTNRSDGNFAAPLLLEKDGWSDYYKNLTKEEILSIDGFNTIFPDGVFEYNKESFDLYFYGIKNGNKMLKYNI